MQNMIETRHFKLSVRVLSVEESEKNEKGFKKVLGKKAVCTINFFFDDLRTGANVVTQRSQQISGRQKKCTPNATHQTHISRLD